MIILCPKRCTLGTSSCLDQAVGHGMFVLQADESSTEGCILCYVNNTPLLHQGHGTQSPRFISEDLQFLAWPDVRFLSYILWNYHLVLWENSYCTHIDLLKGIQSPRGKHSLLCTNVSARHPKAPSAGPKVVVPHLVRLFVVWSRMPAWLVGRILPTRRTCMSLPSCCR